MGQVQASRFSTPRLEINGFANLRRWYEHRITKALQGNETILTAAPSRPYAARHIGIYATCPGTIRILPPVICF
jgi:hypothetical protein